MHNTFSGDKMSLLLNLAGAYVKPVYYNYLLTNINFGNYKYVIDF